MNKIFAPFLPPWVETGLQPAFYDIESGTVLQQTARMYAKVQQLTRLFNELSEETKTEVENFEHSVNETVENFEHSVNETVSEYIEKFTQLKDFVEDYFDNLDVQEEINHKLDEMAEQGVLANIISQYLNSIAIFGYDTVADMKNSQNLVVGSYARTMGYHTKNDGGGALYKIRTITNDDVIDEGSIIEMNDEQNQLVAELIVEDSINVKQFGAYGDDTHDDSTAFQNAINYLGNSGTLYIPKGTYLINDTINTKCTISIIGNDTVPIIRFGGTGKLFSVAGHPNENSDYILKPRDENAESKPIFKQLCLTTGLLTGKGKTDTIGIAFDTTNDTIMARGFIENVQLWHFDTAILIGKYHFYLMNFVRTNLTFNNTGIKTNNDRVDSGEKISMTDCLFDTNKVGIEFTGQDYDMNIYNTSIDFNDCFIKSGTTVVDDSRKIIIDGCHYETNSADYVYDVNTPHGFLFGILAGTTFYISNSKFATRSADTLFFSAGRSGSTYFFFDNNRFEFRTGYYSDVEAVPYLYYFKSDDNFFVHCKNNNSVIFNKPISNTQAINKTPGLTSYIASGAATLSSNVVIDSANQNTNWFVHPDFKVNVGSYNITTSNSRTGYKGLQFIPSDNTKAVQVVVTENNTIPNSDDIKRVCIAATNCSKVEYQIAYYNQAGSRIRTDSWYTALENNTVEDKALIIPHCPNINKSYHNLEEVEMKCFVRLTGIVGKTPELNAMVVHHI